MTVCPSGNLAFRSSMLYNPFGFLFPTVISPPLNWVSNSPAVQVSFVVQSGILASLSFVQSSVFDSLAGSLELLVARLFFLLLLLLLLLDFVLLFLLLLLFFCAFAGFCGVTDGANCMTNWCPSGIGQPAASIPLRAAAICFFCGIRPNTMLWDWSVAILVLLLLLLAVLLLTFLLFLLRRDEFGATRPFEAFFSAFFFATVVFRAWR
mmetsp:Transcript_7865/g.18978  ORF Transcript_7865/g.18978 Transcript_7865/m.18978 type:complete len:208 (+) Transcript_7865:620-1243(+)